MFCGAFGRDPNVSVRFVQKKTVGLRSFEFSQRYIFVTFVIHCLVVTFLRHGLSSYIPTDF